MTANHIRKIWSALDDNKKQKIAASIYQQKQQSADLFKNTTGVVKRHYDSKFVKEARKYKDSASAAAASFLRRCMGAQNFRG